ncbi:MAG: hypothetical protein RLZZ502_622 [Pseudomonadota bacterium]
MKKEREYDEDGYVVRPSKTKTKAAMTALQDLGETLLTLSSAQVRVLNLPEPLTDAIIEAPKVRGNEGKRRHRQLIGKLMRGVDSAPIEAQLKLWDVSSREAKTVFKNSEIWRDKLIKEPGLLGEFSKLHPKADADKLRSLIAAAQYELAEKAAGKEPKTNAARALFRAVHSISGKIT